MLFPLYTYRYTLVARARDRYLFFYFYISVSEKPNAVIWFTVFYYIFFFSVVGYIPEGATTPV